MASKVYVEVRALHRADGSCVPESIRWTDGEAYPVDAVRAVCRAAATRVGGCGIRYTVRIGPRWIYLFDAEDGRWFLEPCGG